MESFIQLLRYIAKKDLPVVDTALNLSRQASTGRTYTVILSVFLGEIKGNDRLLVKYDYYALSESIPKRFAKKDKNDK